jgi:hypothetical protein
MPESYDEIEMGRARQDKIRTSHTGQNQVRRQCRDRAGRIG